MLYMCGELIPPQYRHLEWHNSLRLLKKWNYFHHFRSKELESNGGFNLWDSLYGNLVPLAIRKTWTGELRIPCRLRNWFGRGSLP